MHTPPHPRVRPAALAHVRRCGFAATHGLAATLALAALGLLLPGLLLPGLLHAQAAPPAAPPADWGPVSIDMEDVRYPHPVAYLAFERFGEPVRMAYMDVAPAGEPNGRTVVLLHGASYYGLYWAEAIEALTAVGYRVVVPDQLGWGRSTKAVIPYSLHLHAANTRLLLEHLGVEQAAIVGHSMGGMLATRFALLYPEATTHMVMVNPIGLRDTRAGRAWQEPRPEVVAHTPEALQAAYRARLGVEERRVVDWKPEFLEHVRIHYGWILGPDWAHLSYVRALNTSARNADTVVHDWPLIAAPSALIAGEVDGPDYPEQARDAVAALPRGTLVLFPNVGHNPHLEVPEQFHEALLGFLGEVPGRGFGASGDAEVAAAAPVTPTVAAAAPVTPASDAAAPVTPASDADRDAALARVLAELEPEVRRAMEEGAIPSVTLALTAGEEILWSGGFGETNLRTGAPATPESVYIIASTLKTMMATVALQLVEEGHFGLDDPVRPHLGGLVLRGEDPSRPITLRHLLTHRSGIGGGFSSVPVWADTVPQDKDAFLRTSLRILGPPGAEVRYSNPAFTLLAQMIEVATGNDVRDEVRRRIWEPLGMRSTDFAPSPRMEEVLAVPYRVAEDVPAAGAAGGSGAAGGAGGAGVAGVVMEPLARTRFAEWPAGGAWGTVEDQARWLMAAVNGGRLGSVDLLQPATVAEMYRRQYDPGTGPMGGGWGGEAAGYGLAWWVSERGGEPIIAHSGSVGGYTAFLHGVPGRALGVAMLTNGNRAHPHLVRLSYLAADLLVREGLAPGR